LPHPDGSRPHLNEEHQKAGSRCCLVWFQAWESGVRCWSCQSQGTEHLYEDRRHLFILNEQVHQIFNLLCEEAQNRRHGYEKICASLLTAFVTMADRELQEAHYHLSFGNFFPETASSSPAPNDPIGRAQEYVRSHLSQPLTIEGVARTVLMSRAQFTKRFRREVGQTFLEFVTNCRLEHAKNMLRESDWTAFAICSHAGFKSYSYFGKLFRSELGMTPGEFRRQARAAEKMAAANEKTSKKK
jgi:AraC-like DNA-binding protein